MRKNLRKNIFIWVLSLVILMVTFLCLYVWIGQSLGNKNTFLQKTIGPHLSQNTKNFIKKNLFKRKFDEINAYNYKIINSTEKGFEEILQKSKIEMVGDKISSIQFKINSEVKSLNYKNYSNEIFLGNGPRAYLGNNDNNLFLITGSAQLFVANINDISIKENNKFFLKKIETNLNELIKTKRIQKYRPTVKGLLIADDKIYVSFIKEENFNCYFNSIVSGNLNSEKIIFEPFFDMNECQKSSYLSQSGGAMANFKSNSIIYSIGDYRSASKKTKTQAQNKKSLLGKIIEINKKTGQHQLISIGHRNPQGLFFDTSSNVIISSEHGPKGGCEININIDPKKIIKNYGWPIASYGEHYDSTLKSDQNVYDSSPLFKSHKKHGFVEPELFFNPSIAPSQLIKVSNFFDSIENQFMMGSMGNINNKNKKSGKRALHFFSLDKNYKIQDHQYVFLNERVRDLTYSRKFNKIFAFLESSSSVMVIEKN